MDWRLTLSKWKSKSIHNWSVRGFFNDKLSLSWLVPPNAKVQRLSQHRSLWNNQTKAANIFTFWYALSKKSSVTVFRTMIYWHNRLSDDCNCWHITFTVSLLFSLYHKFTPPWSVNMDELVTTFHRHKVFKLCCLQFKRTLVFILTSMFN